MLADELRGGSRRMRAVRIDWYARSLAEPARKRVTDIERWQGGARGRSRATAWRELVFTVATAPGPTVAGQTRASLAQISANLAEAGTDHTRLLSATVYLTDIANKAQMDAEWCEWIGDPANLATARLRASRSRAGHARRDHRRRGPARLASLHVMRPLRLSS